MDDYRFISNEQSSINLPCSSPMFDDIFVELYLRIAGLSMENQRLRRSLLKANQCEKMRNSEDLNSVDRKDSSHHSHRPVKDELSHNARGETVKARLNLNFSAKKLEESAKKAGGGGKACGCGGSEFLRSTVEKQRAEIEMLRSENRRISALREELSRENSILRQKSFEKGEKIASEIRDFVLGFERRFSNLEETTRSALRRTEYFFAQGSEVKGGFEASEAEAIRRLLNAVNKGLEGIHAELQGEIIDWKKLESAIIGEIDTGR